MDDTVCFANDAAKPYDYKNAIPIPTAILEIKRYYNEGWFIIFCTARYFRECNGDIPEIYKRGYDELKQWLDKYGVPYDLIVLGKPSATLYLDDKAFRIEGKADWTKLRTYLTTKERFDAVI